MADAVIQLRDLQARHNELQQKYKEATTELEELRDIADASISLQAGDVQTAKIIELSKKNRTLSLAVEKEKQRVAKLQAEVNGLKAAGKGASGPKDPNVVESIARDVVQRAAEAAEMANKEAAQWKERFNQQTNKIAQLEQKVFSLEIDSKKLTRALAREVGDDVPLSKVLDESSDWRGRREQLVALRQQVQALKAAQGMNPDARPDASARKALEKVSVSKAAELEQLRVELVAAKQEADAAKSKAEGAISRRKILEAEISSLKEKVGIVLNKTQNDDRLIAALKTELAMTKGKAVSPDAGGAGGGALPAKSTRPPVEEDDELWHELSTLRRRCQEQRAQIDRYEGTIQSLNQRLLDLQQKHDELCEQSSDAQGRSSNHGGGSNHLGGRLSGTLRSPGLHRQSSATGTDLQTNISPNHSRGSTPQHGALRSQASHGSIPTDERPLVSRGSTGRLDRIPSRSPSIVTDKSLLHAGGSDPQQHLHSAHSMGFARTAGGPGSRPVSGNNIGVNSRQISTPVTVREEVASQQLKVAEVEISRLQELVQLQQSRIAELEDELDTR